VLLSGLVKVPPSGVKPEQLLAASVPVSRVTAAEERSSPDPPDGSDPFVRLKVTGPPG
jgi:hypothetical protein